MKVWDYNILLHTYYGPRVAGGDLSYPLRCADRGFSPTPNEAGNNRTFSLDTFPQEYSTCGVGDFRLPSIWEATEMRFTADKLVDIAKEAPELGIEMFVMDNGWPGDVLMTVGIPLPMLRGDYRALQFYLEAE